MSSDFVSPTIGWMNSPSTISSADLVMYSCARWIGLRVWNATTVFQPRSSNVFFVSRRRQQVGLHRVDVLRQLLDGDRAGDRPRALAVGHRHAGVLLVRRTEDLLGLVLQIALVDLLDGDRAELRAFVADQLDRVPDLARLGGEGDRDRPRLPVGQPHVVHDRLPRVGALEALERREAAVRQQLEIRSLLVRQLELAHAAAAPTFSSTSATTFWADSSGDSVSVSRISSACSGSS